MYKRKYCHGQSVTVIQKQPQQKKEKEVSANAADVADVLISDAGGAGLGAKVGGLLGPVGAVVGACIVGSYTSYRTGDDIMKKKEAEAKKNASLFAPYDPDLTLNNNTGSLNSSNIGYYHNAMCNFLHQEAFLLNFENIDRNCFRKRTYKFFNNIGILLDSNDTATDDAINELLDWGEIRDSIYVHHGREGLWDHIQLSTNIVIYEYIYDMFEEIDAATYWDDVFVICDNYAANAPALSLSNEDLEELLISINVTKYSCGLWISNLLSNQINIIY